MTAPSQWTDARVADLRLFWSKGFSAGEIARKFGTTRCAVIGKLDRLGLIGRGRRKVASMYWTDAEDAILRDGWSAGTPVGTIAERIGRTRSAITHRAQLLGLGHHPNRERDVRYGAQARWIARDAQRASNVVPLVQPEPPPATAVPFLERARTQCAWPMWHDSEHRLCCGAPVLAGAKQPYCTTHLRASAGIGTLSERNAHVGVAA